MVEPSRLPPSAAQPLRLSHSAAQPLAATTAAQPKTQPLGCHHCSAALGCLLCSAASSAAILRSTAPGCHHRSPRLPHLRCGHLCCHTLNHSPIGCHPLHRSPRLPPLQRSPQLSHLQCSPLGTPLAATLCHAAPSAATPVVQPLGCQTSPRSSLSCHPCGAAPWLPHSTAQLPQLPHLRGSPLAATLRSAAPSAATPVVQPLGCHTLQLQRSPLI